MADYYDTLGVTRKADSKEIRQAFRKLARQYHPDLNPGDTEAETKFKSINEAYEVLSNDDNRKKYDKHGDRWKQADQIETQYGDGSPFTWTSRRGRPGRSADPFGDLFGGGPGDLFGGGGGPATATRVQGQVEITLEEAFAGTMRNITLTTTDTERRLEVTIPPGVDTGSVVRISPGEGQEVLLKVTVLPHKVFERKGPDLYIETPVPLDEAVLGGETEIQTLKSKVRMKVPPESQNGQRVRLAGQGMPKRGSGDKGDLYVTLRPRMPKQLTDEERDLFERLRTLRSEKG